jgi:DNA primase
MASFSALSKRCTPLFDVFRERVMFPIRSIDGQVLGFIGRASPSAAEGVPKYLNSRETALYRKSQVLFGLHESREP